MFGIFDLIAELSLLSNYNGCNDTIYMSLIVDLISEVNIEFVARNWISDFSAQNIQNLQKNFFMRGALRKFLDSGVSE